jgi:hypothetical protein
VGALHRGEASRLVVGDGVNAVRECLKAYADRGVFRGYTERPGRLGRVVFRFSWLARHPYELQYEPRTGTFVFLNALPNMPARTPLARALKTFVKDRVVGLLLAILIGAPLLSLVLWLFGFAANDSLAWLYVWGFVFAFQMIMLYVAPVWIMPLFNKFEPLEDGELKDAIKEYNRIFSEMEIMRAT